MRVPPFVPTQEVSEAYTTMEALLPKVQHHMARCAPEHKDVEELYKMSLELHKAAYTLLSFYGNLTALMK